MLIKVCDNNCYINYKQIKLVCEASTHPFDKPIEVHKNVNTTPMIIYLLKLTSKAIEIRDYAITKQL